jgi:hypothetical protein
MALPVPLRGPRNRSTLARVMVVKAASSNMKQLYSSNDIRGIGVVRSVLDEAGVVYEVQNETIPYPGAIFYPEVWVDDSEYARACELRDAVTKLPSALQDSWTCPSCREHLEGQFGSCWNCGAYRNVAA